MKKSIPPMREFIRGRVVDKGIRKDAIEQVLQEQFEPQTTIIGLTEIGGEFVFTNRSKLPLPEAHIRVAEVLKINFGDDVVLNQAAEAA
jgi:hypothetical protein